MTGRSRFNKITIDIDSIHGVHVGNTFRSVLSDFPIPCPSKNQDRSQLVQKNHHHIGTIPFHHRRSFFVLDGHGDTLCLRIVRSKRKSIGFFKTPSLTNALFSLKLSFHFVKHPTYNVLWLLVITCRKHCYKFQSNALVENVTLVGVDVVPSVGVQNLG